MLNRLFLPLALLAGPLGAQAPAASAAPAAGHASTALQQAGEGVAAVLLGTRPAEDVFAPEFLAAVSAAQLKALTEQIAAQFGPLQGLENVTPAEPGVGTIGLRFARAVYSGTIVVRADGKVTGLQLNDYRAVDDSAAAIERDLAALPGSVSALYAPLDGGKPLLSVNAERQFAIGSAFKLYVLAALARQIEGGRHKWDEVVRLDDVRSLPSGQVQDWPRNSPVTLHTLATMMISISDNSATDQLIRLVGRDAVAAEVRASGHSAPARMLPFLTTREMFTLKADPAQGASYGALGETQQAAALEAMAQAAARDPAPVALSSLTAPTLVEEVEWFASSQDLRRILGRIAALQDPTSREILSVKPSVAPNQRKAFSYAGFKGGSEPGVLNLTWLLQTPAGEWRVLTVGWNDPARPVEEAQLGFLAQRIMALP